MVRGEAALVSDAAERGRALTQLRTKYPQYRSDMLPDDAPIVRITPERITSWGKIERKDT
ncbi:MAG: hypothetical protein DMG95_12515 [Acidobacteria bacterium]|nr:MAG: hypothetical protein DMG95_12515 [Acidobacteriota bacterium]